MAEYSEKTQAIRILDVVAIGPLMVYAGAKAKNDLPGLARASLVIFGLTTIAYNAKNFIKNEEEKRRALDKL